MNIFTKLFAAAVLAVSFSASAQELQKFNAKCVTTDEAGAFVRMMGLKNIFIGNATGLWEDHIMEIFVNSAGYTVVFVSGNDMSCVLVEGISE